MGTQNEMEGEGRREGGTEGSNLNVRFHIVLGNREVWNLIIT